MSAVIEFTDVLVVETCCVCHLHFAVPSSYQRERKERKDTFYCPSGHGQSYTGPTEAQRLRDELARQKHATEQAQESVRHYRADRDRLREEANRVTRRLNATRGVVTRQKRKISNGQCPCCSMKFKDLKQHMQAEHPNWNPDAEAAAMEAKS